MAGVDIKYHSVRNGLRRLYPKDSLYMQLSEESYYIIWFAILYLLAVYIGNSTGNEWKYRNLQVLILKVDIIIKYFFLLNIFSY